MIDVFANQVLDPRRATRHNIAPILIYLYQRTSKRLGHPASHKEIDAQILHSEFYKMVFGSWKSFLALMENDNPAKLSDSRSRGMKKTSGQDAKPVLAQRKWHRSRA